MSSATLDDFTDTDGALVFWHPVDDAPIDETFLPWGDTAPGSSDDTRLRVANTSTGYQAGTVIVRVGGPADTGLADASSAHLVSADGQSFLAAISLGDLPPQSISGAFTLRRVTPPDAADGAAGFTLSAVATTWTPASVPTTAGAPAGDTYDPGTAELPAEDPQ